MKVSLAATPLSVVAGLGTDDGFQEGAVPLDHVLFDQMHGERRQGRILIRAALTKTFVSTTILIRGRLDSALRVLDEAVDIVVGKTGGNDACARFPTARDQLFVEVEHNGHALVGTEAAASQLGGKLADGGLDFFRSCHTIPLAPASLILRAAGRRQERLFKLLAGQCGIMLQKPGLRIPSENRSEMVYGEAAAPFIVQIFADKPPALLTSASP